MKKSILIVLLSVTLAITFNSCNNSTSNSTAVASKTADKEIYTCSMHPEVRTDKPGDCPKCGMKLIKMEETDTTKMNDHPDTTMKMK
jgi:Cu(I)/Ag(I) efflux system membrane fusion protein